MDTAQKNILNRQVKRRVVSAAGYNDEPGDEGVLERPRRRYQRKRLKISEKAIRNIHILSAASPLKPLMCRNTLRKIS